MTADLTALSLASVDDKIPAHVAQPSETLSGNEGLEKYKLNTLQSVASLAPQSLGLNGSTAKNALSSYIAQLKTPDAAS